MNEFEQERQRANVSPILFTNMMTMVKLLLMIHWVCLKEQSKDYV
jgi:hypothetical protein